MEEKITLVHGGDWAGYMTEYGVMPLDFSANVSPLGVPEGVHDAICRAASQADRYPDPLCRALRTAIAEREKVSPAYILCGNGAADLIFRVALAQKPRKALVTAPSFAEYTAALKTVDCEIVEYMLKAERDFRLDADFLRAIVPGVDMVFLCQPNNPTGLTSPRKILIRIAQRCRESGALLVLDECFTDFLDVPEEYSMKTELEQFPNLLILKAFTKLYGMAGVRLGYVLGADHSRLEAMARAGQPWAVSSLAQEAGIAALKETDYVRRLRNMIGAERPWLSGELTALGLRVIPGEANYLLFACDHPLLLPLRQRGILIRSCANYPGLDSRWYRVAVRSHVENQQLVQAIREVLA